MLVRIPPWAEPGTLRAEVDGQLWLGPLVEGYLLLRRAGRACTVTFAMAERRSVESICYVKHTIDWRGDQIVAMSPQGALRAMFPPVD